MCTLKHLMISPHSILYLLVKSPMFRHTHQADRYPPWLFSQCSFSVENRHLHSLNHHFFELYNPIFLGIFLLVIPKTNSNFRSVNPPPYRSILGGCHGITFFGLSSAVFATDNTDLTAFGGDFITTNDKQTMDGKRWFLPWIYRCSSTFSLV